MAELRRNRILTFRQLEHRLDYWQGRLALGHWSITLAILPMHKMNEGSNGSNNYDNHGLQSRISLLDPDHWNEPGPYDMEFVLVHELLHLWMEVNRHSDTYDEASERDLEQAINAMARTLISFEDEKRGIL